MAPVILKAAVVDIAVRVGHNPCTIPTSIGKTAIIDIAIGLNQAALALNLTIYPSARINSAIRHCQRTRTIAFASF